MRHRLGRAGQRHQQQGQQYNRRQQRCSDKNNSGGDDAAPSCDRAALSGEVSTGVLKKT
ncbi:MAG: hypothetical protein H7Z15_17790 [Rhizobacter sp.]|nr:hypothetical protein [Rhizobacter sp.]